MLRKCQSMLRDFVGLLRDLSMGVTEAHTVELPHRPLVETRMEPSVTDIVWPLK
jgi:hypothetical protein